MKTSKQTLIVCWFITLISFVGLFILHEEFDIWLKSAISRTKWTYDYSEREFYQGIWSNIFTGAIVSVFTTYVAYGRAKHEVEAGLKICEDLLVNQFLTLASSKYLVNIGDSEKNHAAIARFTEAISNASNRFDEMMRYSVDYCPFIETKKVKALMEAKNILLMIWVEIHPAEDSLLVYTTEEEIKKTIDTVRNIISKRKEKLDELSHTIWRLR